LAVDRDGLIAALNEEPDFVTGEVIDFIGHVAVKLRPWNTAIAMGDQSNRANAEYHQGLRQQLDNALLAPQLRCADKLDVACTGRPIGSGSPERDDNRPSAAAAAAVPLTSLENRRAAVRAVSRVVIVSHYARPRTRCLLLACPTTSANGHRGQHDRQD